MLLVGTLLMGFWMFLVGGLQGRFGHWSTPSGGGSAVWVIDDNQAATRAVIVCSYLFVCSFAITMGPVSWTYPAELVRVFFPKNPEYLTQNIAVFLESSW
jgi:hypothetical protein